MVGPSAGRHRTSGRIGGTDLYWHVPWPRSPMQIRSPRSARPFASGLRPASRPRPRPRRMAGRPSLVVTTRSSTRQREVARPSPRSSTRSIASSAIRSRPSTRSSQPRPRALRQPARGADRSDVERNLRAPLSGMPRRRPAGRAGASLRRVAHRRHAPGGPPRDRPAAGHPDPRRPNPLYLMLTSQARDAPSPGRARDHRRVHAIAGSKRGAHLALSLEQLEHLRRRGSRLAAAHRPEPPPSAHSKPSPASSAAPAQAAR